VHILYEKGSEQLLPIMFITQSSWVLLNLCYIQMKSSLLFCMFWLSRIIELIHFNFAWQILFYHIINTSRSFPHSWLITKFVIRATRWFEIVRTYRIVKSFSLQIKMEIWITMWSTSLHAEKISFCAYPVWKGVRTTSSNNVPWFLVEFVLLDL
jgi:hypothetical protein